MIPWTHVVRFYRLPGMQFLFVGECYSLALHRRILQTSLLLTLVRFVHLRRFTRVFDKSESATVTVFFIIRPRIADNMSYIL